MKRTILTCLNTYGRKVPLNSVLYNNNLTIANKFSEQFYMEVLFVFSADKCEKFKFSYIRLH